MEKTDEIQAIMCRFKHNKVIYGVVFKNGYAQYILPKFEHFFGVLGIKTLIFPPKYYALTTPIAGNPDFVLEKPDNFQPTLF